MLLTIFFSFDIIQKNINFRKLKHSTTTYYHYFNLKQEYKIHYK